HHHITITRAYWADEPGTPEDLRRFAAEKSMRDNAARLYVHGDEWWDDAGDYRQYRLFLDQVDRHLVLRARGRPDVKAEVPGSFFSSASSGLRDMDVVIPPQEYAKMVLDVPYAIQPVNGVAGYRWRVKDALTITRRPPVEERLEQVLRRLEKLERR